MPNVSVVECVLTLTISKVKFDHTKRLPNLSELVKAKESPIANELCASVCFMHRGCLISSSSTVLLLETE